jgi:hypothetical protein
MSRGTGSVSSGAGLATGMSWKDVRGVSMRELAPQLTEAELLLKENQVGYSLSASWVRCSACGPPPVRGGVLSRSQAVLMPITFPAHCLTYMWPPPPRRALRCVGRMWRRR